MNFLKASKLYVHSKKPTCFDKSVFQLNPPFRVGEILPRNLKYSLRSSEIAVTIGGFNFIFCRKAKYFTKGISF